MRKTETYGASYDGNIENYKRRRALPSAPGVSGSSKFFDRILSVRRAQELVFITKSTAKNR